MTQQTAVVEGMVTAPCGDVVVERPARVADPSTMVIFGGTGDLAKRKLLPALYNLVAPATSAIRAACAAWATSASRSSASLNPLNRRPRNPAGRTMPNSETAVTYQIGELAARSGVTPDALRYYERLGLLAPPRRTTGGFRRYPADTLERLRFIKQAQTLGLTLHEIRELVTYQDQGGRRRCRHVRDVLLVKLTELQRRVAELQEFQTILSGFLGECERALALETADGAAEPCCPVIETLKVERH